MARPPRITGFSGSNLRRARKDKRWSQAELSQALGVHRATLVRWEQDQSDPQPRQAEEIARVLECDVQLLYEVPAEGLPADDPRHLTDVALKGMSVQKLQSMCADALRRLGVPAEELAEVTSLPLDRVRQLLDGEKPTMIEVQLFRTAYGQRFLASPSGHSASHGDGHLFTADEKMDVVLQRLARLEQRLERLDRQLSQGFPRLLEQLMLRLEIDSPERVSVS